MNLSNDVLEKKISSFVFKIFIAVILIFVGIVFVGSFIFFNNIKAVNKKDNQNITFAIESGWSQKKIAKELKNAGLIRNENIFIIYSAIIDKSMPQAGVYYLKKSMNVPEIIEKFNKGDVIDDAIQVSFIEGKRFLYFAEVISNNFGYAKEDIEKLCADSEYLKTLIDKYWFLTDEILNKDLYYPLEGYLFPDTYKFHKNATIQDIITKLLDGMDNHLSVYKEDIKNSGYSVHSLLTIASMVELEAVTSEDRLIVSGIFQNRLKSNWRLDSDVTTYYAEKKALTEKLTVNDLNKCNAYNTRGSCLKGLPVGPICSPSYTSIIASIKPKNSNFYYFVADKKNNLYFATNENEHQKNITDLKSKNLWPE